MNIDVAVVVRTCVVVVHHMDNDHVADHDVDHKTLTLTLPHNHHAAADHAADCDVMVVNDSWNWNWYYWS
jgi:hypothetical protein